MRIVTRIGTGRVQQAALYSPRSGKIKLFCKTLRYENYLAYIKDPQKPTEESVTCKRCLAKKERWL